MTKKKCFRSNVAAIFINDNNQILVLERLNHPEAWQFPQGGVDGGESLVQALFREVREELSVTQDQYEFICSQGFYRYEFPETIKEKFFPHVGQEQVYFLCKVNSRFEINLNTAEPEFSKYKWIHIDEYCIDWVPDFKKTLYKKVFIDFFSAEI